ncbi:MAG: hypothetical protein J0L97_03175 [Alphaproteobacteria bacterium]|nr:hypothetical protein [Alphaproteobacteria bacterium]
MAYDHIYDKHFHDIAYRGGLVYDGSPGKGLHKISFQPQQGCISIFMVCEQSTRDEIIAIASKMGIGLDYRGDNDLALAVDTKDQAKTLLFELSQLNNAYISQATRIVAAQDISRLNLDPGCLQY